MYKYKTPDGKIYTVSEDRKKDFLLDHPNAILIKGGRSVSEQPKKIDTSGTQKYTVDGKVYTVSQDRLKDFKKDFGIKEEQELLATISEPSSEELSNWEQLNNIFWVTRSLGKYKDKRR